MWVMLSLNLMAGIAPKAAKCSTVEKIIIGLLVTIGTPFMFINQSLETLLGVFLGSDWDEEDNDDERIG
jgi:hypothetical protein